MSRKFYAVHRETGERWRPNPKNKGEVHEYLVMYDSGYLAVVTEDFYTYIRTLDPKVWRVVKQGDE